MSSQRSHTRTRRLTPSFAVVVLFLVTASAARGQTPPDLFTKVGTLTLSDGTPATGNVSISGNSAVVGTDGIVSVFHRGSGGDHWMHVATLMPSDGTSGFGKSVDVDRRTIVVGANGAAFVFQRALGGWQEVKKLTADTNTISFGTSVAVSGTTVVVGAPVPDGSPLGPGLAYVFERDQNGPHSWGEVTRLIGNLMTVGRRDAFGLSVSIDRDRLIVGASRPTTQFLVPIAYVFSRNVDEWSLDTSLGLPGGGLDANSVAVSISRDTAVGGTMTGLRRRPRYLPGGSTRAEHVD